MLERAGRARLRRRWLSAATAGAELCDGDRIVAYHIASDVDREPFLLGVVMDPIARDAELAGHLCERQERGRLACRRGNLGQPGAERVLEGREAVPFHRDQIERVHNALEIVALDLLEVVSEHPVQVRSLVQDMSIVLAHQRRLPFTARR